jgi:uncharacterized membrane protein
MDRTSSEPRNLEGLVKRNVRALVKVRKVIDSQRSLNERIADAITAFAGTMWFAYVHALVFGSWILFNSGLVRRFHPFDPFPFVMLAMIASVEAIFLSTFVLVSQNRAAGISESRAELDLQVNLLAERELTEIIQMVEAIAHKLDVPVRTERIEPLKEGVSAEKVLDHIEDAKLDTQAESSR